MKKGGRVIVLETPEGEVETWGSLSEICRERADELPQNYLKRKKFPFEYKSQSGVFKFRATEYREKANKI